MRLLISVVLIVLAIGLIGFLMTNLNSKVSITVWSTEYPDVHTFYLVLVSVFVGFALTAIIAIAEGTRLRFENRRLKREVRKQETELNYLRTQPGDSRRPEPDSLASPPRAARQASVPTRDDAHVPTAPVYGMDEDDPPVDPDDDLYSGGRAV
jgi:uncharacterized membrane protein YciS (DUF1049 family)